MSIVFCDMPFLIACILKSSNQILKPDDDNSAHDRFKKKRPIQLIVLIFLIYEAFSNNYLLFFLCYE